MPCFVKSGEKRETKSVLVLTLKTTKSCATRQRLLLKNGYIPDILDSAGRNHFFKNADYLP
jgi:hypothetical protein